ncbi:MAG: 4-(cytidine 5'-diphospho)-2-C-methyl-D-erythritol kinase [Deltaproteobacteria bacterium]|nr:MAG: 4-(cytidine 5'-diphospho)-2-C-methyl-D-erythritol kinase [Deltaproteobacteria bacterium]
MGKTLFETGDELESVSLLAPAKINLFLRVLNRRKDGYHEIRSLMVPISIFDRIRVEKTKGGGVSLEITGPFPVPDGGDNTCVRAAELFFERWGCDFGVNITVEKNIPAGAGLGGGSSDAGAVLKALSLLAFGEVHLEELEELSLSVGSDVPFFVRSRPALVSGRGEVLTPYLLNTSLPLVVVKPEASVSTAWAYGALGRGEESVGDEFFLPPSLDTVEEVCQVLENDFEEVVFSRLPEVEEVKRRLVESGALGALMSGSGSAVFGIFDGEGAARTAAERFSEQGYFSRYAETL